MASIEILNAIQANAEAPVEIQLSLGNATYRGPAGKSAYEIAVENGFSGTLEQWVASLKGKTPEKGVDYFTPEDIQEIVDQIEIEDVDLSGYATIEYVDDGLAEKQENLVAGNGINLVGSTISSSIEYLTNSDILAIWNS